MKRTPRVVVATPPGAMVARLGAMVARLGAMVASLGAAGCRLATKAGEPGPPSTVRAGHGAITST